VQYVGLLINVLCTANFYSIPVQNEGLGNTRHQKSWRVYVATVTMATCWTIFHECFLNPHAVVNQLGGLVL